MVSPRFDETLPSGAIPTDDPSINSANTVAALAGRLNTFETALHAHTTGADQDGLELFAASHNLTHELHTSLETLPEAERTDALLTITDQLHALLPSRDRQTPDSTWEIDTAIGRVVRSYAYMLDPETVPLPLLRQLTRISTFCGLGVELPELAQTLYRRDHNALFGSTAPDFVRDTRFTSTLLDRFLQPHLNASPRPAPAELMLSNSEVRYATEIHLMAYGFSGAQAATIASLWGTLWKGDDGSTGRTFGALISNLDTLDSIERDQPGLALRLFQERGVAHFGRYPEAILLQQFDPLPEGIQSDFMLLAHTDHNGAFSQTAWTLANSLGTEDLKGLRIAEVDSPEELVRLAGVLADQFGPAVNLIIGGHGEEDTVTLGPAYQYRDRPQTALHIDQVKEQLNGLIRCILPDGSVLLISCSTGAKDAIGQRVANTLNVRVQAPATPHNILGVHRDAARHIIANFQDDAGRSVLPESVDQAA